MSTGSPAILQIHWSFPPTTGGVESHLFDLSETLTKNGRRVVLLTGESEPVCTGDYEVITTPLLDLRAIKGNRFSDGEVFVQFRALLLDIVMRHDIRIIHGHNLHHFHAGPALAVDEVRRTHGIHVHHTFHETWPDLLRENPVYRLWDGNYAVSRFVQAQCDTVLGFQPSLFPLGVNIAAFNATVAPFARPRIPVILHPARLLPWKGVDVTVRSLRIVLDRGHAVTLVITDTQQICDWNSELVPYRAEILGLVEELGLSPFVMFQSATYRDMPMLYQLADIVVYPTIGDEPYGLVPLEAMACGRPIIASQSGGIPETVIDDVTGYVIARNDPAALADRLCDLLSAPDLARQLGAAGRTHVELNFDNARYTAALLSHFDNGLVRNSAAPLPAGP